MRVDWAGSSSVLHSDPRVGAHGSGYHLKNLTFQNSQFQRESHCEGTSLSANGLNSRTVVPPSRKNTSHRDGKVENGDWLAAQISSLSVQEVVDSTGMTDKAVQNIRRKKSKISFDNLVDLLRDKPELAAAFAVHVGLILPGEAEFAGALTKAFNAYQRRGASS